MRNFLLKFLVLQFCLSASARIIVTNSDESANERIEEDNIDEKLKSLKQKFVKFREKFLKNQTLIVDESEVTIKQQKSDHDNDLKDILEHIKAIQREISSEKEDVDTRKQEVMRKMSKISNSTFLEFEKLKEKRLALEAELNENKTKIEDVMRALKSMQTQCLNCYQINFEEAIKNLSDQLIALDKESIENAAEISEKLKSLRVSTATALNEHYRELIAVYEEEENELQNKGKLISLKDNLIDEWKEYSENVEGIQVRTAEKLSDASSSSLNINALMTIGEQIAIESYSVNTSKTRFLIQKSAHGLSTTCSDFFIDGDDLIATDCAGLDFSKIVVSFNSETFSCWRDSNDNEKYFVYDTCSIHDNFTKSPCKTFLFDWSGNRVYGGQCSSENTPRSIKYNDRLFKCGRLAVTDDGDYQYENCFEITDEYEVDGSRTRFFLPRASDSSEEKTCERFTTREGDDIYASHCLEVFGGVPKMIVYNEKRYKCLNFEFDGDDDFLIYESCTLDESKKSDDNSMKVLETIHIPTLSVFRGFTTRLSTAKCMKYVINKDRYSSFDCQTQSDSVYLYDGRKLECDSLEILPFSHKFSGCEENEKLFAPTTRDLNLKDYKVTSKTIFFVPRTTENDLRVPCGPFSYRVNDFLFQTDCLQTDESAGYSVSFNGRLYRCRHRKTTAKQDYLRFEDCSFADEEDEAVETFAWVEFHDRITTVPQNIVYGGYDQDGLDLFVIRKVTAQGISYGKGIDGETRKNGYITSDERESGTHDYEILTADQYAWCKYDPNKSYDDLPVCRAMFGHHLIPGTLVSGGLCRFGHGWRTYFKDFNFQILVTGTRRCEGA